MALPFMMRPMPRGLASRGFSVKKGCPIDGPLGWYVPQTEGDFAVLGLAVPDFLWLCQESSGNLATSLGAALPLVATASGHLYQQAVTGWGRKFLGTDGVTASQGWRTSNALLDLAAGASAAMIGLFSFTLPLTNRVAISLGAAGNNLAVNTAGQIRTGHVTTSTNGTVNHAGLDSVHQFCWYRNATTNVSGAVSELDNVIASAHNEDASTGDSRGIAGATPVPEGRFGWFAIYKGANAEQDWSAYLATMRGG